LQQIREHRLMRLREDNGQVGSYARADSQRRRPEVGIWEAIVIARDGQRGKDRTNGISSSPARILEVRRKTRARISENLDLFAFFRHAERRDFSVWTASPMRVVIAQPISARCLGATGDHFQPHYRMAFALMSGQKDGPFSIDLAASHRLLILWLRAAPPASYANVGGCGIQNGNASSNHTPSASKS
jgi:hypothetical protein